jgi:hypothetical protein
MSNEHAKSAGVPDLWNITRSHQATSSLTDKTYLRRGVGDQDIYSLLPSTSEKRAQIIGLSECRRLFTNSILDRLRVLSRNNPVFFARSWKQAVLRHSTLDFSQLQEVCGVREYHASSIHVQKASAWAFPNRKRTAGSCLLICGDDVVKMLKSKGITNHFEALNYGVLIVVDRKYQADEEKDEKVREVIPRDCTTWVRTLPDYLRIHTDVF